MKQKLLAILTLLTTFLISSQEFGTNDLRISDMGPNGETSYFAFDPRIAYSATDDKYLVVWNADDDTGALVDNEFEIYGQFIDANGSEIGTNDFRISFNNSDGDTNFRTDRPDVAWNSTTNQFLVVWEGETSVNGEIEIYGQLINGDGTFSGSNFRISDVGTEGSTSFGARRTEVIYNATNNEYMVVWEADDSIDNKIEIYAQRISATGTEIGTNDFQISNQLPANDANFDAKDPDVTWNSTANEYLIVWQGETTTDNEREIYAQRYDANNNTFSGGNFKISDMGTDGDINTEGLRPKVAYNSVDNQYLVVWQGDDITNGQYEVYGQLLSNTGTEIGTNDFRISTVTNINSGYDITRPEIIWNSNNNEYFIAYKSDSSVDNDFEIYGQFITNQGMLNGSNFLLSDMGPDADTSYGADDCIVATNGISDYIIAWEGDDNTGSLVDNEKEIFIQMYKNETLSIQENNGAIDIRMYPNPSSDYVFVNTEIDNNRIKIYDVLGKQIIGLKVSHNSIEIRSLEKGIYFIQFQNDIVKKMIKN